MLQLQIIAFIVVVILSGKTISTSRFIRNPSPSDLLPFLKASPIFPTVTPPIFPAFISNARVDLGVGLPGGRGTIDTVIYEF